MFERLAAAIFGGAAQTDAEAADARLVAESIEAVVEAVEPRIRLRPHYEQKLEGCIRRTISHLREMSKAPLEPVLLTRASWAGDPRVNAFFATPDDVPECLGHSRELRAYFADPANEAIQEAWGLLGMKKVERTVYAPQLQGDAVRHDVAQITVSFSAHRIIAPSDTLLATRVKVGRRIIQRLAQVALSRIIAVDMKASELQERKAYLGARLRVLTLARDGMEGLVSDMSTIADQMATVQAELAGTVDDYIEVKASLATLDGYIQQVDAVFGHPEQHLSLTTVPLRVSRLGVKMEDDAVGAINELTLTELAIGEGFQAVIAIVRCPRSELPPEESRLARGERYL